ncbi:hypothetical protein FSARC_7738 [Fusarium sarcochroum]|uniref:Uncharacterized protein n=1 Tax=Fusarium sarcochroum TaxID=1208366 RepID=A0A8H4X716_9HYPO|nr:hypothetical protein FSARC_7738 [Fusarium sarcochroum]
MTVRDTDALWELFDGSLDNDDDSSLVPFQNSWYRGSKGQQICAVERQDLTTELDRIVTERIEGLKLQLQKPSTRTPDDVSRPGTTQIGVITSRRSPEPTVDIDDSTDGDYQDSQPTRPTNDKTAELRRSDRTKPYVPTSVEGYLPSQVPNTPDASLGTTTPSPAPDVTPADLNRPPKTTPGPQSGSLTTGKDTGMNGKRSPGGPEVQSPSSRSSTLADSTDGRNVQSEASNLPSSHKPSAATNNEPPRSERPRLISSQERWPRGRLFGQKDLPGDFPKSDQNHPSGNPDFTWKPFEQNSKDFKGFFNPFANLGNKDSTNTKVTDGKESG